MQLFALKTGLQLHACLCNKSIIGNNFATCASTGKVNQFSHKALTL